MISENVLPELLAPAGSEKALEAAIEGGADAVYFGGGAFNARMRAENFDAAALTGAVALCHTYGVRAYITLNTLLTDRELPAFLAEAQIAYEAGADALIVADLGGAAALRQAFPDLALHASTQLSGHNVAAARELKELGFSRMVLARETPAEDMRRFVREAGIETEVFVHGALCVSHSGQCLFSSLVGGRSGNRGECAQPCRLPDARGNYPLSLKDLSLAGHITELIGMGVDSLKIEGRLKSPEYVRGVTAVFRRLLDERRSATAAEWAELAAIFSRGGFTDGYFTRQTGREMLGIRSERDKENSRAATPFAGISRRVPLDMTFSMKADVPVTLTATANGKTVTVTGAIPEAARTAPMDAAAVQKNLCRLGGTPYTPRQTEIAVDDGLMLPVSALNALRRAALAALAPAPRTPKPYAYTSRRPQGERVTAPTARFRTAAQITPAARDFFAIRYLPADAYDEAANGVEVPPVIFDGEASAVREFLQNAVKRGAKHALVGNIGHLALAVECGLVPHGDFRLNVTNGETLTALLDMGFADVLLSPELTLPQLRDIGGASDAIVYGRVPLMLLEKCVGREVGDCRRCANEKNQYVDRRGEIFPVFRVFDHRNILCNARRVSMSDRRAALTAAHITAGHYLFTDETPDEVDGVLAAYRQERPLTGAVRRIPQK